MSIEYKNRRGDVYFLQAGKTKTGKPKYYFGKKLTAAPVEAIPDGYEIRESPDNGQVTLRKCRLTDISPLEKQMLSDGIRTHAGLTHFIVDVDGNSLVVYLADTSLQDCQEHFVKLSGILGVPLSHRNDFAETLFAQSRYSPMMRFTLTDVDERLYGVERWCFLGSIDDWFFLAGPAPLSRQIAKYAKHLGKESFYELM